jgi:uncharacterized RDD family membrane protein YckC
MAFFATPKVAELQAVDPYDIGWWIESADEEIYGPVSRKTLRQFLEKGEISPNTLIRHSTQSETKPVADHSGMVEGLALDPQAPAVGDRLAEVWPRRWKDQLALAEDSLPCARHKRPAVLFCLSCLAPYCSRCRVKPFGKQYYFCRHCQSNHHNRRFGALIVDGAIFNYIPIIAAIPLATAMQESGELVINLFQIGGGFLFLLRDSLFRGAGPGKRLAGLRVVKGQDGTTPIGHGQGILRWLSQFIPLFNLFDAFVPLRDPLLRRYGDRWAKTRVIDTPRRLTKTREKVRRWLAKKGVKVEVEPGMTMERFAQLGG